MGLACHSLSSLLRFSLHWIVTGPPEKGRHDGISGSLKLIYDLKKYNFDKVFIFNSSLRYKLISKFAGIKNIYQYPLFEKKYHSWESYVGRSKTFCACVCVGRGGDRILRQKLFPARKTRNRRILLNRGIFESEGVINHRIKKRES